MDRFFGQNEKKILCATFLSLVPRLHLLFAWTWSADWMVDVSVFSFRQEASFLLLEWLLCSPDTNLIADRTRTQSFCMFWHFWCSLREPTILACQAVEGPSGWYVERFSVKQATFHWYLVSRRSDSLCKWKCIKVINNPFPLHAE